MTAHLTPEQFVDLAEGGLPEPAVPHLAACEACQKELAELRAMMTATVDADAVPEPSPLFWNHLSARVRDAVEHEGRPFSWRDRLLRPFVLVPSLGAALIVLIAAVTVLNRTAEAPAIPSSPLALGGSAVVPETIPSLPPLAPLGTTDDPQLNLVAAFATAADWDEMADEVALTAAGSTDAVVGTMTVEEQRELQRLLAEEMAQPPAPEIRS